MKRVKKIDIRWWVGDFRCQPCREAKIVRNERRGEQEGSRERLEHGGAKQSAKKFRFGSTEI